MTWNSLGSVIVPQDWITIANSASEVLQFTYTLPVGSEGAWSKAFLRSKQLDEENYDARWTRIFPKHQKTEFIAIPNPFNGIREIQAKIFSPLYVTFDIAELEAGESISETPSPTGEGYMMLPEEPVSINYTQSAQNRFWFYQSPLGFFDLEIRWRQTVADQFIDLMLGDNFVHRFELTNIGNLVIQHLYFDNTESFEIKLTTPNPELVFIQRFRIREGIIL